MRKEVISRMTERKPLSKRTRFDVFKRDKFTCQYCGKSAPDVVLHVDHIVPVSKGGTNDIINLVTACQSCNLGKSNIELSDDSVMKVRKSQLDDLAKRREQLEMMYEWQLLLADETATQVQLISDLIGNLSPYIPNENGESSIRSLLSKFDYEIVIESARIAFTQYPCTTSDEWNYAFDRIGGICYYKTHRTCSQCTHDVGYDPYNHLVECEFDFDGSKWCKNSYAEHCDYYEPKWGVGDPNA